MFKRVTLVLTALTLTLLASAGMSSAAVVHSVSGSMSANTSSARAVQDHVRVAAPTALPSRVVWEDTETARALDSNSNGNLYTNPVNYNNLFQNWYLIRNNDGSYGVKDVATGRCLDSNFAGNAYTNPCQAANVYQHWYY